MSWKKTVPVNDRQQVPLAKLSLEKLDKNPSWNFWNEIEKRYADGKYKDLQFICAA